MTERKSDRCKVMQQLAYDGTNAPTKHAWWTKEVMAWKETWVPALDTNTAVVIPCVAAASHMSLREQYRE